MALLVILQISSLEAISFGGIHCENDFEHVQVGVAHEAQKMLDLWRRQALAGGSCFGLLMAQIAMLSSSLYYLAPILLLTLSAAVSTLTASSAQEQLGSLLGAVSASFHFTLSYIRRGS